MEHPSRFFDRMLEYSPLWYLTLFSEHASQSFWSPSPWAHVSPTECCYTLIAISRFNRCFEIRIINYFDGFEENGPDEYFSKYDFFRWNENFPVHLSPNHIRLEIWNKVMIRDIVSSGRSKWIDGRLVEYVQKKRWNSEDGGSRGWVI